MEHQSAPKAHYHHGNLKQELLETSIRVISQEGFDTLSLRKVSALCGVSHNALYRHFANKEQLIEACRIYVTETLTEELSAAMAGAGLDSRAALERLSECYVQFYQRHPTYYSFLYRNVTVSIHITLEECEGNYPPFDLFRRSWLAYGTTLGLAEDECLTRLVRLWSMLHGMVALLISPYVAWQGDWKACLNTLI